jgi:hypothetical protein
MRPSVVRTFSAITSRATSVFLGPACRGRSGSCPSWFASITRRTVLWVVPHNAAAPR